MLGVKKPVPNALDVVTRHARELARAAFVAAAADLQRCPHDPAGARGAIEALDRVLTLDEWRHFKFQYREELHALNARAELAAMKAGTRPPRPLFTAEEADHIAGRASGRIP